MRNSQNVAIAGSLGMALLWPLVPASVAAASASQEPPPPPRMPGQQPSPGSGSPFAPPGQAGKQLVKMRMAADVARITPGQKFHLAFIFDIEPQWHIYWHNAGSSGAPTEVDVKAPPGFAIGRTLYPRPEIMNSPEGATYGYEGQTVLLVEVTPPASAMPQVNFSAKAGWLVCKDICKSGSASESLMMPFGNPSVGGASESVDPIVDTFKQRVPKALDSVKTAEARFDGSTLMISVPAQKFSSGQFIPADTPGVEYGEAQSEKVGAFVHVTVPVKVEPRNALGKPLRVAGVVGLGESPEDPSFEFEIPLDAEGRPASSESVHE